MWIDPVGWSEHVAKTKLRVFIWTLIHLCVVLLGCFMIDWSIQATRHYHETASLSPLADLPGVTIILFIGVWYPAMYLYAMHRLLAMLKAQQQPSSDEQQKLKQ